MLFRPHRGSLNEAMREVTSVETRAELEHHLLLLGYRKPIKVKYYAEDTRIGWPTYIVTADLDGSIVVAGFTNGDFDE